MKARLIGWGWPHELDLVLRDQAADRRFDAREHQLGLLDSCPGRRPHVKAELPGIHLREEVAPDEGKERQPAHHDDQEGAEHAPAPGEGVLEGLDVRQPEPLEPSLERIMDAGEEAPRRAVIGMALDLGGEQVAHERRNDRAREQIRRQHRKHDGHGQGREEVPRRAGEEHHRHEDDADRQGRDERGGGDLLGAVEDRLHETLAEAQVAVNVLDLHRGVVDEDADGQCQPAERHHVEGLADRAQDRQRGEDRERDRGDHDQGAAPAPEEEQDHDSGEAGRDRALGQHAGDGGAHEERLVEELLDLEPRRRGGPDGREQVLELLDDRERRGAALLDHGEQHRPPAVLTDHVGLHREAVAHVRHVAQVDRGAVDDLDGQLVELGQGVGAAVEGDPVLARAELHAAGRQRQVLEIHGGVDVRGRDRLRQECLGIEIDHDLPRLAAVRQGERDALDRRDLLTDAVDAVVVELGLRERLAAEGELDDRHAGGVVLQDEGRDRARGHAAQDRL